MTAAKNFAKAGGMLLPTFLVFSAVSILASLWAGYVWRSTAAILLFSIAITFILVRHFKPRMPLTKGALLIAVLAFAMAAYPFIFITPFYQASADPAYLITIRAIQDRIPETYAPYSDLKFSYQIGHALFARLFVDLFAPLGVPDYVVQWLLGSLLAALETLLIFSFGSKIFRNNAVGELSALLYLGSRPVFLNLYWGAHPMILGMLFVVFSVILFHERSALAYIAAPAAFVSHPMAALNGVLLFAAYLLFNKGRIKETVYLIPAIVLALPSFLTTYSVLGSNILAPTLSGFGQASASEVLSSALYYLPLWVGLIPSAVALLCIALFAATKIKKPAWLAGGESMGVNKEHATGQKFLFASLLILFAVFVLGAAILKVSFVRLTNIMAIVAVVFSSSVLLPFLAKECPASSGWRMPRISRRKVFIMFKVAALVLSLALFFGSSLLTELRTGTQITAEEAKAAFALLQYDPGLKLTLFLSPGRLKMAEYSNKIPYNPVGELFLPTSPYQAVHDAAWDELMERDRIWRQVCGCDYFRAETITRTEDLCIDCIPELGAEYVVVNRNYFPEELPWQKVLSSGSIDIYRLS